MGEDERYHYGKRLLYQKGERIGNDDVQRGKRTVPSIKRNQGNRFKNPFLKRCLKDYSLITLFADIHSAL